MLAVQLNLMKCKIVMVNLCRKWEFLLKIIKTLSVKNNFAKFVYSLPEVD